MSKSSKPALSALVSVNGFLRGQFRNRPDIPPEVVDLVVEVQRGIGSLLDRSPTHDAGAFARCSFCGRYTAEPAARLNPTTICDCGRGDGWSGSFECPGDTARWSTGLLAMREVAGEQPSASMAIPPTQAPGAGGSLDGDEA